MPNHGIMPNGYARTDGWAVYGTSKQSELSLSGAYSKCLGDGCPDMTGIQERFEVNLKVSGEGKLLDFIDGASVSFVRAEVDDRWRREANQAFRGLIQPILDGDCNKYLSTSLDAAVRATIVGKEDAYCSLLAQEYKLLEGLTNERPMYSYLVTSGVLSLAGSPLYLDSEILIQKFFSGTDGSGVSITAVLRRQRDNSWRIRALL
jgi:hypothetical protein